ncbi:tape measure protein [Luteimonas composti]|uniref:Tape measure protein n=1 Tax=Luteimonas composti TaxID=398257 RepID=A0ABT6MSJ6_9GAMM|nr:tape measure protein [Luteimonas composti]MDH7453587.1 tape measure protein [Luteimonas composti]
MNSRPNLRVRISADLADIKQGLGMLRGELAKVRGQAQRALPDNTAWSRGLAAVRSQLVGIVSAYGALRAGGAYVRLADEAANLAGRLRLATKSQEEFNRAQQGTFRLAQDTSAEWGSVVALYARLSQTTNLAQDDILALTKTISQSFAVSGADAVETANGIRQLSQAIAGGVLRAEEFNTIVDTNGRLVQALGDELGIHSGQVRQYVNDGKVSSEILLRAIRNAADQMDKEFGQLPLTVARATTQLRNSLTKLVGDTDKAEGASKDLAVAISDLARFLESDDAKRGFADLISGLTQVARLAVDVGGELARVGSNLRDVFAEAERFMARNANVPALLARQRGGNPQDALGVRAFLEQRAPWLYKEFGAAPPPDFSNVDTRHPRWRNVSTTGGGGSGAGTGGGGDPAKAIAASNALLRDSVARALAELDQLYKAHDVGIREYFATRQQLQERAIDLQVEQARAELAITKDAGKRRDIEEQIAILMRDRAELGGQAARGQADAENDLIDQLGEVKARLAELGGDPARAARIRIEAEFLELFKKLRKESHEAGEEMVRNLVEQLVRKAQTDAIRARASDITSRLQSEEGSVSAQVDAGMLGFVEGQERLRQARMVALEQLAEQIRLQREVLTMMSPGSPEHSAALQGLHELQTGYLNIAASVDVYRNQVKDVATDALSGFFMDLVEGTKSAGDALRDFVRNFALGMAQIAARALATFLVLQMLDAIYPGLGKTTAAMMGAGQNHAGGKAGQVGGVRRWVPEAMLGVAPRYHGGGMAGLQPGSLKHNEVVSVLERGETIRTQQQEKALQAQLDAGSGRMVVKTPVVAIGDRAVADALAGAAGEDVVLTHVRNNWQALSSGA